MALDECPKSYITAESETVLEEFLVRKHIGGETRIEDLSARRVDAFAVLEKTLAEEKRDGQRHGRRTR